jgi:hypothetical protein
LKKRRYIQNGDDDDEGKYGVSIRGRGDMIL